MTEIAEQSLPSQVEQLLLCPIKQLDAWLSQQVELGSLALLTELKTLSDATLLSDPQRADEITQRMLVVAERMPSVCLAMPLAYWARGNWATYHDPHEAVRLYQQALVGYRQVEDSQITARLLSNLIGAALQCGQFDVGHAAYIQSAPLLEHLPTTDHFYLLPLYLNYGLLLHYQGNYTDALRHYDQAEVLANKLAQPDMLVDIGVNRALTFAMMGQLRAAEAILIDALHQAIAFEQRLTVARIHMNLGELAIVQGKPANALASLQMAEQEFSQLGNSMEIASIHLREAELLANIGALKDAQRKYQSAAAQFTALAMTPEIARVLTQSAIVNRRYGEFREAERLLFEAQKLWQSLAQPTWQTIVAQEQITLALAQHNFAAAFVQLGVAVRDDPVERLAFHHRYLWAQACFQQWRATADPADRTAADDHFARVLAYARQQGDRWSEREALIYLARIHIPTDPQGALAILEQAHTIDTALRLALSVEELKASFLLHHDEVAPLLIQCAMRREDDWLALHYLWRAKSEALFDLFLAAPTDALSEKSVQEKQNVKHDVDAEIRLVRTELAAYRWQLQQRVIEEPWKGLTEGTDRHLRALEEKLADLRRRRNREQAGRELNLPYAPEAILAKLEADVIIEYMICDDQVLVILIERSHGDVVTPVAIASQVARCRTLWLGPLDHALDLLDEVQMSLQDALLQSPQDLAARGDAAVAESQALLHRCHQFFIAPLGALPTPARLLIAPHRSLHFFPFAAFWDGNAYLVERFDLGLMVTAATCLVPPSSAPPVEPLVIASTADERLPATKEEVAAIRASWPSAQVKVDDPHALNDLLHCPQPPCFLHIAAHSVQRDAVPLFSALQLADGLLTIEQCYELPLHGVELVTLSSCMTTAGLDTGGGLLALQSAFLAAGASHVLTSLWPIADEATAYWMQRFYHHYASGAAPAAALWQTQRELLCDAVYGHPVFWAPFVCYRR